MPPVAIAAQARPPALVSAPKVLFVSGILGRVTYLRAGGSHVAAEAHMETFALCVALGWSDIPSLDGPRRHIPV